MANRQVDISFIVVPGWDREQCSDRPALNNLESVVEKTPLDVLRTTEMSPYALADCRQCAGLFVTQGRVIAPCRLDDLSVAKLEPFRNDCPGDERLADARAGFYRDHGSVSGHRIGVEHHTRRLGQHHSLHDDGHPGAAVTNSVPLPVRYGAFGEKRGPATAYGLYNSFDTAQVEE